MKTWNVKDHVVAKDSKGGFTHGFKGCRNSKHLPNLGFVKVCGRWAVGRRDNMGNVISPDQGNFPMATLPEMLDDLDLAMAWIKDNLVSKTASDERWQNAEEDGTMASTFRRVGIAIVAIDVGLT